MYFMTVKLQRFKSSNWYILQQKLNTLPRFIENMAKMFLYKSNITKTHESPSTYPSFSQIILPHPV